MRSSQSRRLKIVAVGLFIPGTGFTRVFESVFHHLGKEFEIHWLGIAYKGPQKTGDGYTLYPNNLSGGDMFGAFASADLAQAIRADIVLFLNDVWMLKNYRATHSGRVWRTAAYIPLDGTITDPTPLEEISWLDQIIAYHAHARHQFVSAFQQLHEQKSISSAPNVDAIYHGVDFTRFSKPDDGNVHWRASVKRAVFGAFADHEDSIFILNANRFNERKDLFTTISAFAAAVPLTSRKIYLCLHQPAIASFQKAILESWINQLGCQNRVILNPLSANAYLEEEALAALYQACEIGINTTLGEGWGLISFEHAACFGAQILPAHEALKEIWDDAAEFADLAGPVKLATNPFQMYQASSTHFATLIARLCNDPEYLLKRCEACYLHARSEKFDWKFIASQWSETLTKS